MVRSLVTREKYRFSLEYQQCLMNYSFEVEYLEQIISFSALIFRFLVL